MQPAPLLSPFYEAKDIITQVWQRWFNLVSKSCQFIDRGDPSAADFTQATLTTDATWRDLDLSSIIPESAVAVLLAVDIRDDAVGSSLLFRKNGNANNKTISGLNTQVLNVTLYSDCVVFCDTARIIEYYGANVTFTAINITVKGWWI